LNGIQEVSGSIPLISTKKLTEYSFNIELASAVKQVFLFYCFDLL